jgi:TPR repeat protein
MALIKCPECGNEVSTNASACPVCGNRKLKKKTRFLFKVIIVIFILTVIGKLFGDENADSPKQAEDAETQYQRGYKYGEKRDYVSAIRWYQKAADQGYAPAEYELGEIYMYVYNFIDTKKGLEFYQKAADKEYAPAQAGLGVVYDHGANGISKNHNKAMEWYQKAADNGNIFALSLLADIYYEGKNVPKNYKRAYELYHKVAVSDISEESRDSITVAQLRLGEILYNGYGMPKDFKKAFEWYQKAAEADLSPAQRALGTMYEKGEGVPQDYIKAIEWYQKAVDNGLGALGEDAKRLERLKKKYGK